MHLEMTGSFGAQEKATNAILGKQEETNKLLG